MQLKAALQDGHFNLSASEAEQLLEQVDLQHRGLIDFEEWAAAMADWRSVSSGRMRWGGLGWGWAGIRHRQDRARVPGECGGCRTALAGDTPTYCSPLSHPAPFDCCALPCSLLQFKTSQDWDQLVTQAFQSMATAGEGGVISAEELERLLCGDEGCEVRRRLPRWHAVSCPAACI